MNERLENKNTLNPLEISLFKTELGGMIAINQIVRQLCTDRPEIWNYQVDLMHRYPGSYNIEERIKLNHNYLSQKLFFKYNGALPIHSELAISTYLDWENESKIAELYSMPYEEQYILTKFENQLKHFIRVPDQEISNYSPIFDLRLNYIINRIISEIYSVKNGIFAGQLIPSSSLQTNESLEMQIAFANNLQKVYSKVLGSNRLLQITASDTDTSDNWMNTTLTA